MWHPFKSFTTWVNSVGVRCPQMNLTISLLRVCTFELLTIVINILRIQKPYLFALRQHRENLVYEVPRIMTEHFDNYFMQLYSAYVDRYRQSLTNQTTLQMQITNKKFDTKVKQFGVPVWMPVDSYLALPVGRVPRYKLLLSDLARRLPEDRRDEVNGCISTIERFLADLHNRAMQ